MEQVRSQENHWVIIKNSSQKGKIIESTELWGTSVLTVWIPNSVLVRYIKLNEEEIDRK